MEKIILLLIISVATAINLIVVKYKIERKRYADAFLDGSALITLAMIFGGSFAGLTTATFTSAIISVYLWFNPPMMTNRKRTKKTKNAKHIQQPPPKPKQSRFMMDLTDSLNQMSNDMR